MQVTKATKEADGTLTLDLNTGSKITDVNCLLWAIGRVPNSDTLGLDKVVSIFYYKLFLNRPMAVKNPYHSVNNLVLYHF